MCCEEIISWSWQQDECYEKDLQVEIGQEWSAMLRIIRAMWTKIMCRRSGKVEAPYIVTPVTRLPGCAHLCPAQNDYKIPREPRSLLLGPTPGTVSLGWSDASSCLPPSSVICSLEPTVFLLQFLTTRLSLMLGFAFAVIHFYFAFTVFLLSLPHIFTLLSTTIHILYGALYKFGWLFDWLKLSALKLNCLPNGDR